MPSPKLEGVRVALLEARMSGELSELIRRHGGIPHCVPSLREASLECDAEVSRFLDRVAIEARGVVVFLTGAGATSLFREAERLGRLGPLPAALNRQTVVCRGPKPSAALKRYGVAVDVSVPEPYTTTELLQVLAPVELKDVEVTLVHYGERNDAFAEALRARAARLAELCLYEWRLPEDVRPLEEMVEELIAGRFDAIVFTSQIQFRHLLQVAASMSMAAELIRALNGSTVVAAIGPVCLATLETSGVAADVVPEHPKMGPLVARLADHFHSVRSSSSIARA
jgi:uroporphyrinogen-III synthase